MAYNSVTKAPTLISLYLRNLSSNDYRLFSSAEAKSWWPQLWYGD